MTIEQTQRPTMPKLKRGDKVVVQSGGSLRPKDVHIVTGAGPKWIRVVGPDWFDTPVERHRERCFSTGDYREGEPGKRVGAGCRLASFEQDDYDVITWRANMYLITVARVWPDRSSPFASRDGRVLLARTLRELLPQDPSGPHED